MILKGRSSRIIALISINLLILVNSTNLFSESKENFLKAQDAFDLEFTSDVQISSDGKKIVYVRQFSDIMSDQSYTNLQMVNFDGSGHQPLTSGKYHDSSPRWSPDGKTIIFISDRNGHPQIFKIWLDTNEISALTNMPYDPGAICCSPDGEWIAFSAFVSRSKEPIVKLPSPPQGARWADPPVIVDRMIYRFDGAGYLDPGQVQLFVLPSEGGTPRKITQKKLNYGDDIAWTPDGNHLLVSASTDKDNAFVPESADIYNISVQDGTAKPFTNRKGPDTSPAISPDGRHIAYVGFDDRYQGYQLTQLYIMDRDGSQKRLLSAELDRSVARPYWDGKSKGVYFLYDDLGNKKIGYISLQGKFEEIARNIGNGKKAYEVGGDYSVSLNDRFALTFTRSDIPSDIAVGQRGNIAARLVTGINKDILTRKKLGEVEEIWFTSSLDKRKIHGWVMKPPDFDPDKKYPLILEIHGGPYANYGDRFDFEKQIWAAADYVVLYTNPRGSTSYGEEFGNLTHHAYPGDDFYDLLSGVDAVIDKGYIDENNLFITGGSGGGILTLWTIGKTNRFRAAVSLFPIANWYSFNLTSDIAFYVNKYWFPGFPWDHANHYMKRSVISLVKNVKTPTMLITGEEDYRTPISESEQYYQALKLLKVDSALVRVPSEGHGIRRFLSHYIARIICVRSWFDKYKKNPNESCVQ